MTFLLAVHLNVNTNIVLIDWPSDTHPRQGLEMINHYLRMYEKFSRHTDIVNVANEVLTERPLKWSLASQ